MSTSYVVEVKFEDRDSIDGTNLLYGPFRSKERALEYAAKIGSGAGLNRNTWGSWAGTDGEDKFAFVTVRQIWSPGDPWRGTDAIQRLLGWFTPEAGGEG